MKFGLGGESSTDFGFGFEIRFQIRDLIWKLRLDSEAASLPVFETLFENFKLCGFMKASDCTGFGFDIQFKNEIQFQSWNLI